MDTPTARQKAPRSVPPSWAPHSDLKRAERYQESPAVLEWASERAQPSDSQEPREVLELVSGQAQLSDSRESREATS